MPLRTWLFLRPCSIIDVDPRRIFFGLFGLIFLSFGLLSRVSTFFIFVCGSVRNFALQLGVISKLD